MENSNIYEDIATRTNGDIYIGVAGPVRTGKSTFIKRFMELLVLPNIENEYLRERARDELPQSGSGRTVMTAEPKFVPEEAAEITIEEGTGLSVRLVDSVGYMVDGALGDTEDGAERMVTTPWFDHEITMREAAYLGTRKVIQEHSTIGIVVTTDGTVTDLPRQSYEAVEGQVIEELKKLGKPFTVILNTVDPGSKQAAATAAEIGERWGASCVPVNCVTMDETDVKGILSAVLRDFPLDEISIFLPSWVDALEMDDPIKSELFSAIRSHAEAAEKIRDVNTFISAMKDADAAEEVCAQRIDLSSGKAEIRIEVPRVLFFDTISRQSGLDIKDDGDLVSMLTELAAVKRKYDRIEDALNEVEATGYGVVMPGADELELQEPEIIRRGGRYSVRLKARAPSIHMIKTMIETEVSPAMGGESSGSDIINFLLQEFEGDTGKIWQSNIFGKSLHDIAGEGLQTKIKRMPPNVREKMQDTLQRIINEGAGALICIIL